MRALRAAWLILAVGFLLYFLATRWPTLLELSRSLSPWQPLAALALLVAAKLLYAEVVRLTLKSLGIGGGYGLAFYAYSVSQVGKYIPGSIWQFVGRYDIYRGYGLHSGHAVELLLLENALLLATALVVGAGAAFAIGAPLIDLLPPAGWLVVLALGAGGAVAAFVLLPRLASRAAALAVSLWRNRSIVVQLMGLFLGLWLLLGLSAYVLFAAEPAVSAPFIISLFGLSYVAGFAAIFAPAGVGVREAVFTVGLVGAVSPETALLLAVGHRILYVSADLLCAGWAWLVISAWRSEEAGACGRQSRE